MFIIVIYNFCYIEIEQVPLREYKYCILHTNSWKLVKHDLQLLNNSYLSNWTMYTYALINYKNIEPAISITLVVFSFFFTGYITLRSYLKIQQI